MNILVLIKGKGRFWKHTACHHRLGQRADIKANVMVMQHTVEQRKIVGRVCYRSLDRNNIVMNVFQLVQIWDRVVNFSGGHCRVKDDVMLTIHCLVKQIVWTFRFPRSVQMT